MARYYATAPKINSWAAIPPGTPGGEPMTPFEHMQRWNALATDKWLAFVIDHGHAFSWVNTVTGGAHYRAYRIIRRTRQ